MKIFYFEAAIEESSLIAIIKKLINNRPFKELKIYEHIVKNYSFFIKPL
jgi:hypothetical protein